MHTLLGIWMGHKYTRPWNGPSFLTAAIQEHTVLEPGHFPMLLSKHPWCGPGGYRFRARGLRWSNQSSSARHEGTHTVVNNHNKTKLSIVGINWRLHFGFYHLKPDFLVQFTNGFQTPNHRIPTVLKLHMQCRSEIGTFQDFKWSKRGCFTNSLNFECGLKSGSPTILNRDKWPPFCQTGPFEIPSLKYSDFQCFSVSNDQISDPRCLSLQNVFFSTTAVYL